MSKPTVWIHSQSDRSLSLFLLFLALMAAAPIPALLVELEVPKPHLLIWTWLPLVLAGAGLYLRNFTRKRFWAEPGRLKIRDGLWAVTRDYRWEGKADIALHSFEDKHGEWWLLDLVCGKPHYPIHKSLDHCGQMRHLGATLARALGGDLIENETQVIPAGELDLALPERLRRHPQLLGDDLARPASSRVVLEQTPELLHFRWRHTFREVLPFFFSMALIVMVLASAPLFPGPFPDNYSEWRGSKFQRSAWDVSREGNLAFFWLSGAAALLATLAWAGVRQELIFTPKRATRRVRMWGIPLSVRALELGQIREIWARPLNYGCDFEVVGEDQQLGGWMLDPANARWIVSRVLRFYSEQL
jgi:hypothetical protein